MNRLRSALSRRPSLPTAIALLALAVASTGTAVAATGQLVNIADPVTASKVARVTSSGQLQTSTPTSTISSSSLLTSTASQDNFITSPTKATLAITKLDLSNPSINAGQVAEVRVYVYQVDVDTSGSCVATGYHLLAVYNLAPGDDITGTFPTPLQVAPTTPSTPYCISLFTVTLGGTYGASYYPAYSFGAYRVSGVYTGKGASAAAVPPTTPPTAGVDR